MQVRDEGKYKISDIDATMQCILMNVPKTDKMEKRHFHEYIELLFGLDCNIDVEIGGKIYKMLSGDLILINSTEIHNTPCFHNAQNRYIVVKFSPQQIYTSEQSLFELKYMLPFWLSDLNVDRRIPAEALKNSSVQKNMNAILKEWQQMNYGYELCMRIKILDILLWLLRYWNHNGVALLDSCKVPLELCRVLPFISSHLSDVTARQAAEYCGYSYTYFSEVFKKAMHMNFRDYLLRRRLNEAEKQLLLGDRDITDIALSVGFSAPSHFIKQFKKIKGITPAQYRLKNKEISSEMLEPAIQKQ